VICLKRQWTAGWDINLLLIRGAGYQFKLTSTDVEHLRLSDEREINSNLAELHHYLETLYSERLVKMVLYGSQARGDARPDSDIDVLIHFQEPFNSSMKLSESASLLPSVSNIMLSLLCLRDQFQQRNSAFFRNVRREGIAI